MSWRMLSLTIPLFERRLSRILPLAIYGEKAFRNRQSESEFLDVVDYISYDIQWWRLNLQ